MDDCSMQMGGEGYGRAFVYDLDSLTGNYKLENSTSFVDYCDHAGKNWLQASLSISDFSILGFEYSQSLKLWLAR